MDWGPIFDGDSQVDKNLTFGSLGDDGGRGNFDSCFLGDLGGSFGVVGKACPEMCMTSSNVTGSLENARYSCTYYYHIPYSRKYWWELNFAVEPKITIVRILADLNLAVTYGIAIRIIICE